MDISDRMLKVSYSNDNLRQPIQSRRLCYAFLTAISAVIIVTPLFVAAFDASPRKASVTTLRFGFLVFVAMTCRKGGPGWVKEAGLASGKPWPFIWIRGFLAGAIPLGSYVVLLTFMDERVFEGIQDQQEFWWAVAKYLPLSLVIGFLEDMLFFGFLATILGGRYSPAVLIYAISHFLAPSKSFPWQDNNWLSGFEALQAMGQSLTVAAAKPVELFGLMLVGMTLAILCLRTGNIWAAMGVHGGWYYVRTISRKLGEDLEGQHEWLFGTDRFYDGVAGWISILLTGALFYFTWKPSTQEKPQ